MSIPVARAKGLIDYFDQQTEYSLNSHKKVKKISECLHVNGRNHNFIYFY